MTNDRLPIPAVTTIYGRETCEDTVRARRWFETLGEPYVYVDLDLDTDARDMLQGLGFLATPTIVTPQGGVEVEPSDETLGRLVGPGALSGS